VLDNNLEAFSCHCRTSGVFFPAFCSELFWQPGFHSLIQFLPDNQWLLRIASSERTAARYLFDILVIEWKEKEKEATANRRKEKQKIYNSN
jgi:hypothetical protein